ARVGGRDSSPLAAMVPICRAPEWGVGPARLARLGTPLAPLDAGHRGPGAGSHLIPNSRGSMAHSQCMRARRSRGLGGAGAETEPVHQASRALRGATRLVSAHLARCPVAMTLDQPLLIVHAFELPVGLGQFCNGREGPHPEEVLLQRADEAFRHAIA